VNTFTTNDGTTIYYKDWGPKSGPVITFSHGWPLSSDVWESQMFFLASHGYRCIAHDRRGHGVQASRGMATTWINTPMIWPSCLKSST
jgi:non-heme chloroperoxidase